MIKEAMMREDEETLVDQAIPFEEPLLATKFFMPSSSHWLLARPRLTQYLDRILQHRFTLVSAGAGYGKTTLLSSWVQSLPAETAKVAWLSLDEEDNDPVRFWSYVFTALERQQPGLCAPFLTYLHSQQNPLLQSILRSFINRISEESQTFCLILDDYHTITQPAIHDALAFVMEHLPAQLHLILVSRTEPPLPLIRWRARRTLLDIRSEQLRCTPEEAQAFLQQMVGFEASEETLRQIAARTEGWLVGLSLFALLLQEQRDPFTLLQATDGTQQYILDYLTEEVLQQQPPHLQNFLLRTSLLDRLTASLCDRLMEQSGSQQLLEQLEQRNLFVIPLDGQRTWYRYHDLFAGVLRDRLERTQPELVPHLHHQASRWYAEQQHLTEAILHALAAQEWEWAADLIEHLPFSLAWGTSKLHEWLEQLPETVIRARPRLCLTCVQIQRFIAPLPVLYHWLDAAEETLTTTFSEPGSLQSPEVPAIQAQAQESSRPIHEQERQDLLGQVYAFRAYLHCYTGDEHMVLSLCEQALTLLSPTHIARTLVFHTQALYYYLSSANDVTIATQYLPQDVQLALAAGNHALAVYYHGIFARFLTDTGQLRNMYAMTQQAMQRSQNPKDLLVPENGYAMLSQANILREWNRLDEALDLALQGLTHGQQAEMPAFVLYAYSVLIHIYMSRGEWSRARSTLMQFHEVGTHLSPYYYTFIHSIYTLDAQVRLWLTSGDNDEQEQAFHWASSREESAPEAYYTALGYERRDVALTRILMAQHRSEHALERLEPLVARATAGHRWDDVIEMRLLQALAYQQQQQEAKALRVLTEAVYLAEPEDYIRRFVDEGPAMADLLAHLLASLRTQDDQQRFSAYLERVLAAFPAPDPTASGPATRHPQSASDPLPEPLSQRQLEVLTLLAQGYANQDIAQHLVITVGTVKSHVSNIFNKLEVNNRVQAIKRARELGLLDQERF
jgi:LuxR family maltose regulon positive regulatory protein